ncbi:gamma-interferon-inducible lysosomal thiol reductase-like protein [Lycorma delicatula]|uniref:gamma-interferon-inducible lysosomal thiol reductase-like protein n=1 Tax=Lycorma delicatula TaxID=130591 RepID=UPI003F51971A
MPTTFKPSRSRIISTLILCLFFYLTYRYMFPSETVSIVNEEEDVSLDLDKNLNNLATQKLNKVTSVTVTVFYECLCPDSRSFFLHHLLPAFEKAPALLDIELVPYGKAKTFVESGRYKFTCQHGPMECYGNKVHACTIDKVKDSKLQIKMVSCMIDDNMNPDERGAECSAVNGVGWKSILDCSLSEEGDVLLKKHGDATNMLQPPVSFIPTVLLNKSQGDQRAILKNLWKEICRQFPEDSQPNECLS